MSAEIKFPAIEVAPLTVTPRRSSEEVSVCAAKVLKTSFFKDYRLIDSTLRSFRASAVRMVRYKPPFWGWRWMWPRQAEIEIEFESPAQLSLEEVHDLVMQMVRSEADIWEESWPDLDELEALVRSAKSIEEIADLLDPRPEGNNASSTKAP